MGRFGATWSFASFSTLIISAQYLESLPQKCEKKKTKDKKPPLLQSRGRQQHGCAALSLSVSCVSAPMKRAIEVGCLGCFMTSLFLTLLSQVGVSRLRGAFSRSCFESTELVYCGQWQADTGGSGQHTHGFHVPKP